MDETYIIIAGDPFSGYKYIGPFPSFEDAESYAWTMPDGWNTWIGKLDTPKTIVEEEE